jgi:hypothetical protein
MKFKKAVNTNSVLTEIQLILVPKDYKYDMMMN